jgi:hypothetical protein
MAAYTVEESNFDDDDLDDLPDSTLAALENHAIRLTQAAHNQGGRQAPPSSDYGDDFDDEDLDDAVVIDEARSAPAIVPTLHRRPLSQTPQREQQFLHPLPYGNTSHANRQRQETLIHQPDHLPQPAPLPYKQPVPIRQGSQAKGTEEVALLRRQLEEVRLTYPMDLNYLADDA